MATGPDSPGIGEQAPAGDTVKELTVEELRAKYGSGLEITSEENMLLSMGPQHPSTHGVFRLVIRTDGEMILESESHVGYLHRCFEKCLDFQVRKQHR